MLFTTTRNVNVTDTVEQLSPSSSGSGSVSARVQQRICNGGATRSVFSLLLAVVVLLDVTADAQNVKLAPELLYVDPYTGIAYNYVLTGQIAPVSAAFDSDAYANDASTLLIRNRPPTSTLRHPRPVFSLTASKRSAGEAPVAVKRERIIMDALGGDYLIRKRTIA